MNCFLIKINFFNRNEQLCIFRGGERGFCVIRDQVFLIFVKGENTRLKRVNCDWFACRDT